MINRWEIDNAIEKAVQSHNGKLSAELTKYRELYKKSINKIDNIIMIHDEEKNLAKIFKGIEKEINSLNKKLSRSAKRFISEGVKTGIMEQKASMRFAKKDIKGNIRIGMTEEIFNKIWVSGVSQVLRGLDGIELSDRIWDIQRISLAGMKKIIAKDYMEGKYVSEIMRDIRGYLYLSDVDMRTKYWKEFFKVNPPGRGVYKSAYQNMNRLIRTEVNRGYRQGAAEYVKKKVWAIGLKWHRIAGGKECAECDEYANADLYGLGDGVYPPDALPISHPNCECYVTTEIDKRYLKT